MPDPPFWSVGRSAAALVAYLAMYAANSSHRPGCLLSWIGRHTIDLATRLVHAADGSRVRLTPTEWHLLEILARKPLWAEPNVLVSPHTATLNSAEDRLVAELFAANATRFLDHAELVNKVATVDFS